MRPRNPFALAGVLAIVVAAFVGLATFSTSGPMISSTVPTEARPTPALPANLSGRAAGGVLFEITKAPIVFPAAERSAATEMADAEAFFGAPDRNNEAAQEATPTTLAPVTPSTTEEPTTTTTTSAPTTTTTHTHPPTTTTTQVPTTTTTHTHAPTTTTAPAETTTTEAPAPAQPPVDGGERDEEYWRPLVSGYFPADMVDGALRVLACESNGDPLAVNPYSGAAGLFQFIPSTWEWASAGAGWGGASPFDPTANVASAWWLVNNSMELGHSPWHHWTCQP